MTYYTKFISFRDTRLFGSKKAINGLKALHVVIFHAWKTLIKCWLLLFIFNAIFKFRLRRAKQHTDVVYQYFDISILIKEVGWHSFSLQTGFLTRRPIILLQVQLFSVRHFQIVFSSLIYISCIFNGEATFVLGAHVMTSDFNLQFQYYKFSFVKFNCYIHGWNIRFST